MHGAMVPIASFVGTGSYVAEFTNIPQTYQDLMLVIYGRDTATGTTTSFYGNFNGLNVTNTYSHTTLSGNGSSASSSRTTNQNQFSGFGAIPGANATAGILGSSVMHILNYANTTTFKTFINRSAADTNGSGVTTLDVGLWQNTAAITSISINPVNAFQTNSGMTLYGIRSVNQ